MISKAVLDEGRRIIVKRSTKTAAELDHPEMSGVSFDVRRAYDAAAVATRMEALEKGQTLAADDFYVVTAHIIELEPVDDPFTVMDWFGMVPMTLEEFVAFHAHFSDLPEWIVAIGNMKDVPGPTVWWSISNVPSEGPYYWILRNEARWQHWLGPRNIACIPALERMALEVAMSVETAMPEAAAG